MAWTDPRAVSGPNTASDMASAAVRLALRNYRAILASCVVVLIPAAAIGGVALGYASATSPNGKGATTSIAYLVGFVAITLGTFLASAAGVHAAASAAVGVAPDWRASYRVAIAHWQSVVAAGVIISVVAGFGLFLLVIPGVFLYFKWFVSVPAVVLERRHAADALRRSWRLLSGRWWATFGAFALVELLVFFCAIPLEVVISVIISKGSTADLVTRQIVALVIQMLSLPLTVSLTTLVYLDLRQRKEGIHPTQTAVELGLHDGLWSEPPFAEGGVNEPPWPEPPRWPVAPEDPHGRHADYGPPQGSAPGGQTRSSEPSEPATDASGWRVSPKPAPPERRISPPPGGADASGHRDRAGAAEPPSGEGRTNEPSPMPGRDGDEDSHQ